MTSIAFSITHMGADGRPKIRRGEDWREGIRMKPSEHRTLHSTIDQPPSSPSPQPWPSRARHPKHGAPIRKTPTARSRWRILTTHGCHTQRPDLVAPQRPTVRCHRIRLGIRSYRRHDHVAGQDHPADTVHPPSTMLMTLQKIPYWRKHHSTEHISSGKHWASGSNRPRSKARPEATKSKESS